MTAGFRGARTLLRALLIGFLPIAPIAGAAGPAAAHQFWIQAADYRVEPDDRVVAELRVGPGITGEVFPYLTSRFISYTLTNARGTRRLRAYEGDVAVSYEAGARGLDVLAYHSRPSPATFDDFDVFAEYLREEGLAPAIERHRERGLPKSGFTETFSRDAKALVQVGPPEPGDGDRPLGLPLELVAQSNPYAGVTMLPVRLLWQGEPLSNWQVSVFRKASGGERERVRTDAEGVATIPLDGGGLFLLSAVRIQDAPAGSDAVWDSHWASLTFRLPLR